MSIILKWKSQIATVDFKVEAAKYGDKEWPFHVTLLDLLKRISNSSKVPIENMKLLHSGVLMKDVTATLGSYGIKNDSKIMMLGDRHAKFPTSPYSTSSSEQVTSISKEQEQLDLLSEYENHVSQNLIPKLNHLKTELANSQSTFKELSFLSRQVGELLLQTQLKVDGVISQDENVRLKRKQVTTFILQLEDEVDCLKPAINKKKSTL